MIKKCNILDRRITFVFRHRFEKDADIFSRMKWEDYKLGVWFKPYTIVSKPKKGPAILGKNGTHSNAYMVGCDLIICKFWFDICYRPFTLKI